MPFLNVSQLQFFQGYFWFAVKLFLVRSAEQITRKGAFRTEVRLGQIIVNWHAGARDQGLINHFLRRVCHAGLSPAFRFGSFY